MPRNADETASRPERGEVVELDKPRDVDLLGWTFTVITHENYLEILDEEGDPAFCAPSHWSDHDIVTALNIQHNAFIGGQRYGRARLQIELCNLLGAQPK